MTNCLNKISKPHIVDLLRIFDKKKTISPRIRYASVRSKPELIKDICKHFECTEEDECITFTPRSDLVEMPAILYDLKKRVFNFDGTPVDVPTQSRQSPLFAIHHGPFLLNFEHLGPEVVFEGRSYVPVPADHDLKGILIAKDRLATKTDSVSSEVFLEPDTHTLSDWIEPFSPSKHCDSTPKSKPARRLSWDS